eukprot:CAMPEP_0183361644 /NCGR_PEP_ID=MMETSP0164_2-20130417/62900_1 /TAXON_ID=221442 /ORGANISM="Coccolithus pelagicus ssp braarudi, Strain PLY182g" /LENGTH=50 /DNA_ID=CAMNT_0025536295 /DNA_START=20 /DNA_END=169 /DNA_ORIENTATION=-
MPLRAGTRSWPPNVSMLASSPEEIARALSLVGVRLDHTLKILDLEMHAER